MIGSPGKLSVQSRMASGVVFLALLLLVAGSGPALAQAVPSHPALGPREQASAPAPPQPAAPAVPRRQADNPGLINEMGKLFKKSLSILPPLKSPSQTIEDLHARAANAAKDAGAALSGLAKPGSMVSGRMICPFVSHGTPDCNQGADRLCQSKGFKNGRSLNIDSAETCSLKVLIPGRARKPGDCHIDNYVTAALCQ
jgi:hypothetical protein